MLISPESRETRLARRASSQFGAFSARQAGEFGFDSGAIGRRVRSGIWERALPGVYRLAGSPRQWRQSLAAAVLWAGEGAAVSHRAAGVLWRLDGVRGEPVEILVPHGRRIAVNGVTCYRSRTLLPADLTRREGLPVTHLPRTLIDLAAVLDPPGLEAALECALRNRLDGGWLLRRLRKLGGRGSAGAGTLRRLLEERLDERDHTDSRLEVEILRLLRDGGLPEPAMHYDIVDGALHVAEVDFAYPRWRVAIQGVSYSIHSRRGRWDRDNDQMSWLASMNWVWFPVTWKDVQERPQEILERVRNVLAARGASLPPKRG
jgi:hypothetical protein